MLVRLVASRFVKSTLSSRLYASASSLPLENAQFSESPVLTPLSNRTVLMYAAYRYHGQSLFAYRFGRVPSVPFAGVMTICKSGVM